MTSLSHKANGVSILLVDDDPCFRQAMAIALRLEGFDVAVAASGDEARAQVGARRFTLALVDQLLGCERGDDVLEEISRASPATRLVSMTCRPELRSTVVEAGRALHLEKPIQTRDIIELL